MKRLFFCLLLSVFATLQSLAQIKWDGEAGDGLWNSPTNWVGDIVPNVTDNVILDNSVVSTTYIVTLPGGNTTVTINSISITPAGANTITLILPSSNIANPGLNISGVGDALILNNRAILKNSSGASSGATLAIANTFRINDGGRYIHNARGTNAGIISQLSTVAGTELGTFEFDVPVASTIISLSGRTFGILELSSIANGGTATYSGNGGSPLNIKGHLYINSGAAFSIGMSADIIIHQNYIQSASSTFNLQNSANNNIVKIKGNIITQGTITKTGTGLPALELNGTTNQNISITGAGAILGSITFRMNNSAGATLLSPLTLPGNLSLQNGKIKTDDTNILTMVDGASTVGSQLSFVEGPMKKIGDEDFEFPIGVGQIYAPVVLTDAGGSNPSDFFIAKYVRNNPQSSIGNSIVSGIDHISYVEYWSVTRSGSATKKVTLRVNLESFCREINNTFVSRYNGTTWTNEGGVPIGTPLVLPSGYVSAPLQSINDISNFGNFTFATDLPFIGNPLPIKLISFDAKKISPQNSSLNWELAACCSKNAKFEIQRAGDDQRFKTLATVNGDETNRFYSFTDNNLKSGINYYRLKMVDDDGSIVYSRIAAVLNGIKGLFITMSPTVITNNAVISFASSSAQKLDLFITDMSGRMVRRLQQQIPVGNSNIDLVFNELHAGIYQLLFVASEGQKQVLRFIKQ